jgi:tol-pal system protein YbgF
MSDRLKTAALAGLLLALLAGVPADAANREFQQLMADMRMMQEQNQQLQVLLGGVADALKAVNARLDEQAGLERKAFADQRLLVDNLSADVRIVREKIDDANVRIASLSQELEALRLAIPPAAPPAPAIDPLTGAPLPTDPAAGGAAPPPAVAGQSPQRLYDTAWADYSAGQWSLAIEGFQTYLKYFPRSPLAGEAQGFIGEAYYADSKYTEALAAYDQVIQNYPTSDAVPNAYYKRGLTLERLKRMDEARESYNTVLQKYPSSSVAHLARQALERVNRAR